MSTCRIARRKYLEELLESVETLFEKCCAICDSEQFHDLCDACIKRKNILNEFNKKGFRTFNKDKKGWKIYKNLVLEAL